MNTAKQVTKTNTSDSDQVWVQNRIICEINLEIIPLIELKDAKNNNRIIYVTSVTKFKIDCEIR